MWQIAFSQRCNKINPTERMTKVCSWRVGKGSEKCKSCYLLFRKLAERKGLIFMEENKVREFLSENFGQVRTVTKYGDFWFVAKDITDILGTATRDIKKILKDNDVDTIHHADSIGREQEMIVVSEKGLYKLIFKSRKPFAEEFQDWICEEVIPSLRKDGMYVNGEENINSEEELIKSVEEKLEQKILRKFSKGVRRDLTDTIEKNWEIKNRNQFATYTDQLINIPVLGCKSKQYKRENEIGVKEALRDYLQIEKLDKIIKQEQDIATLVDYGLDYYQIKELVHKKIS